MKTFFTIIALCGAMTAFAQIEKGRSYLTGQLSFNHSGMDAESISNNVQQNSSSQTNAFGVSVGYGYFVANNWAIGVTGASNFNRTGNADYVSKGNGNGLWAYARRYFPVADKFYIHVDAGLSYSESTSQSKATTDPTWNKNTSKNSSVYLSPGATYFISNRVGLTATLGSVGYSHSTQNSTNPSSDYSSKSDSKGASFNFGLSSIYLGVSVFF